MRTEHARPLAYNFGEVREMKRYLMLLIMIVLTMPAWTQNLGGEGEKEGGGEVTNEGDISTGNEDDKGGNDGQNTGDEGGNDSGNGGSIKPTGPDLSKPEFVIQDNETVPVIQISFSPTATGRAPLAPYLTVFGNGTVRVQKVGRRSVDSNIDRERINKLLEMLVENGIMDFDEREVLEHKQAIDMRRMGEGMTPEEQAAQIYEDDSQTILEINLESYTPPGGIRGISNFHKKVTWTGLDGDAQKYPSIRGIQYLSEAVNQLLRMSAR